MTFKFITMYEKPNGLVGELYSAAHWVAINKRNKTSVIFLFFAHFLV